MTWQKDSRCLVLKGKQIVSDHSTFRGASNKEKAKAENRLKRVRRQEKLPEPSVEILPEVRQYPVSRRSEQALERGTASDQQEPLEREHMMMELSHQQEGWESPQKVEKNGKWKGMDKRN